MTTEEIFRTYGTDRGSVAEIEAEMREAGWL